MPSDWIWHGASERFSARIDAVLKETGSHPQLNYGIEFMESEGRLEIVDEILRNAAEEPRVVYGVNGISASPESVDHFVSSYEATNSQHSIFSQIKDYKNHSEITETGERFKNIQIHREWLLGCSSPVRAPQSANLPTDVLLPQGANLGLVLNNLALRPEWECFNEWMTRFLPGYVRLNTVVFGGGVQIFVHEDGLSAPTPALRLSDGTLRFMSLLAILLNPGDSPLICIEEPEAGLHPDAMALIAELLIEAASKTQIIVTTHSESLVSELTAQAESVLVCGYGQEGTELRRLDSEKLRHWLDQYLLGDLWRMGELGGNP